MTISDVLCRGLAASILVSLLGGCFTGASAPRQTPIEEVSAIASDEESLFRTAGQTGDPALVNRFLDTYPGSSRVRVLILNLPEDTLREIDPQVLAKVRPTSLRGLPPDVRRILGIEAPYHVGSGTV